MNKETENYWKSGQQRVSLKYRVLKPQGFKKVIKWILSCSPVDIIYD